jgi:hypothetical protein
MYTLTRFVDQSLIASEMLIKRAMFKDKALLGFSLYAAPLDYIGLDFSE